MGPPLQFSPSIRSRIPVYLDTLLLLTMATLPTASTAMLETRYIDDEYGDSVSGIPPIYNGSQWSQGATCSTCGFRPDPSQTFNGTWHDNTHRDTQPPSTVQFHFTGMTLDVYCLVPSNIYPFTFDISAYNLSFVLDGQPLEQTFTYDNLSLDTQYNISVLSLNNLAQVPHTFTMIAAAPGMTTTIQFDYAIYTVDTSPLTSISSSSSTSGRSIASPTPATASLSFTPSPSTITFSSSDARGHSKFAAVIGSTIGGILFLVLILTLILYYRRYKHRFRQRFFTPLHNDEMRVDPFHSSGVGRQGPLIIPPAKNALWSPSNVLQEVEDPRAAKRAVAKEKRRQKELRVPPERIAQHWFKLVDASSR